MKNYSIEEIINGIRRRNNDIFRFLYKEVYPVIQRYITNSNGTENDAKDVFQESLIILYKKACEPGFQLSSTIKTYLFSISKNIWYQKSRSKEILTDNIILMAEKNIVYGTDENQPIEENEIMERMKISLLQKYFKKIDRFCQKILQLFYKGSSHEEISYRLKITTDISRSRKKICLQKLMDLIKEDQEYKKFYGA